MPLDVTSGSDVAEAAELIEREAGRLEVQVNNAGISGEMDPGWFQNPTTLDLDAVRTVVASGDERDAAAGPVMAAYAPTKTYLNSTPSPCSRPQLAGTGILVNTACPGLVATDFTGFHGPRTPEQGAATAIRLARCRTEVRAVSFLDDEVAIPRLPCQGADATTDGPAESASRPGHPVMQFC